MSTSPPRQGAFRDVPFMGVIHVLAEAMKLGFRLGDGSWSNLGQGQPEVGPMEGAPERIKLMPVHPEDQAYGPIGGCEEARQAVADHYNRLYRRGKASLYTAENVSIGSGGRLVLSRIFAALGRGVLGYKVPDYTAYQDLMEAHLHRCRPRLLDTRSEDGFSVPPAALEEAVEREGLSAFVVSNPCNPTGMVVQGDDLRSYVRIARDTGCLIILDEFYSHFIYDPEQGPGPGPISAAAWVEDVERDPVLLVDGLTKSFRYPGWRVGWAVGPRDLIATLDRTASSIDGGPSGAALRAMRRVLEPARADQESTALRNVFARKRDLMVSRLREMGIVCPRGSEATFYVWGCLAELPPPLNEGEGFFRAALGKKVITVPGVFFDVNPGGLREGPSPFAKWMRFSFGPELGNMLQGLDRLSEMVASVTP